MVNCDHTMSNSCVLKLPEVFVPRAKMEFYKFTPVYLFSLDVYKERKVLLNQLQMGFTYHGKSRRLPWYNDKCCYIFHIMAGHLVTPSPMILPFDLAW